MPSSQPWCRAAADAGRGEVSSALRGLALPLFLLLLLTAAPGSHAQEQPSRADLEELNDTIARVQQGMKETESEHQALESEVREAEQAIADISARVRDTETDIAEEEERLRRLRSRRAQLEQDKAEQQEQVARYLRSAYRNGRQEYLKLLLNQEDISRASRTLTYYRYFNEARAEKIATFNTTLDELEAVRGDILASTARLRDRRDDLAARRDELQDSQRERQILLDELARALEKSGSELTRLRREREEMERLIEELERSIANMSLDGQQQPFAERRGQLPWPIQGRLLNSFGARHDLGDLPWQGVTIAAREGEDVHAIHHGRVVYADWFTSSGLLLIIDHGDGYMSLYAHNQMLYKEVGDWVDSGEVIAAAGKTGGRREAGVYFEIRHNGRSQDPVTWCVARN